MERGGCGRSIGDKNISAQSSRAEIDRAPPRPERCRVCRSASSMNVRRCPVPDRQRNRTSSGRRSASTDDRMLLSPVSFIIPAPCRFRRRSYSASDQFSSHLSSHLRVCELYRDQEGDPVSRASDTLRSKTLQLRRMKRTSSSTVTSRR